MTPIVVTLVAVAAAVGVIALIDQLSAPTETQVTGVTTTTAVGAAAVAKPESLAMRRTVEAQVPVVVPKPVTRSYEFNHVRGTTLDSPSVTMDSTLSPPSITVNPVVVPVIGNVAASGAALAGDGSRKRLHERYWPAA